MGCNSLRIHPLAGAIGAEVSGVDLADEPGDDTIALIRRAWLDHLVVFFRGQTLPPARFLALAGASANRSSTRSSRGSTGFP